MKRNRDKIEIEVTVMKCEVNSRSNVLVTSNVSLVYFLTKESSASLAITEA